MDMCVCHNNIYPSVLFSSDQPVETPETQESGDQSAGGETALRVAGSPGQLERLRCPTSHHPSGQTTVQLTVWIQYV